METTNERIQLILSEVRGRSLLDVGCVRQVPRSPAEEMHHLHYQLCRTFPDADVMGLDANRAGVQEMRERGFKVMEGDAENMDLRASFDIIIAGELIEHLANPGRFLEGCCRSLKPTGRLILSTPNVFSLMHVLMYLKNHRRAFPFNPEHAIWLCPQTLQELVRRSGLSLIKLHFVDDLEPELVSSPYYRLFVYIWRAVRLLVPRPFRNTMVAVCEPTPAR